MPYIADKCRRAAIRAGSTPLDGGELSFAMALCIDRYIEQNGLCYTTIADAMAAVEGVKAEFYRQVVAEYEDGKAATNGDVFHQSRKALPQPPSPHAISDTPEP